MPIGSVEARSRRLALVLSLIAALCSGTALAQNRWLGVGPYGGVVNSLAIDPSDSSHLYAGSDGGLFISRDGGESWAAARHVRSRTGAVAIDPSSPSTVFAIAERPLGSALFRTRDGGDTWEVVGREIDCLLAVRNIGFSDFSKIVVRPGSPSTVFVATCAGVYRSVDGGETWQLGSAGIPEGSGPAAFAVGIDDEGRLYLGVDPLFGGSTPGRGIFVSDDDGRSWFPSNQGLPELAAVTVATVDPLNSRNVYIGVVTRTGSSTAIAQGMFKSSDAGATWSATGLTSTYIDQIAIDTSDPQQILASAMGEPLFRSPDGGATWLWGDSLGSLQDLVADPAEPGRFYYASREGLFRSDDAAASWLPRDAGLGAQNIGRVFFHDLLPGARFAQQGATWLRSDGSGEWSEVRSGTILAIDPTDPAIMYSSSPPGIAGLSAPSLVRSSDGGGTWVEHTDGLPTTPETNPLSGIVAPVAGNRSERAGAIGAGPANHRHRHRERRSPRLHVERRRKPLDSTNRWARLSGRVFSRSDGGHGSG